MKNSIFMLAAGTLSFCFVHVSFAQKIETISSASVSQVAKGAFQQKLPRNQVPSRAYRHFMKNFSTVKNETWQLSATGAVATFYEAGMQQLAFFDKKGNWTSTTLNYNQSKLPKRTLDQVKSMYCDYAITHCSEVETSAGSTYFLTILKNNDFKMIRIQNEELVLMKQYNYNNGTVDSTLMNR